MLVPYGADPACGNVALLGAGGRPPDEPPNERFQEIPPAPLVLFDRFAGCMPLREEGRPPAGRTLGGASENGEIPDGPECI